MRRNPLRNDMRVLTLLRRQHINLIQENNRLLVHHPKIRIPIRTITPSTNPDNRPLKKNKNELNKETGLVPTTHRSTVFTDVWH